MDKNRKHIFYVPDRERKDRFTAGQDSKNGTRICEGK